MLKQDEQMVIYVKRLMSYLIYGIVIISNSWVFPLQLCTFIKGHSTTLIKLASTIVTWRRRVIIQLRRRIRGMWIIFISITPLTITRLWIDIFPPRIWTLPPTFFLGTSSPHINSLFLIKKKKKNQTNLIFVQVLNQQKQITWKVADRHQFQML